jgi:hypothetical protein
VALVGQLLLQAGLLVHELLGLLLSLERVDLVVDRIGLRLGPIADALDGVGEGVACRRRAVHGAAGFAGDVAQVAQRERAGADLHRHAGHAFDEADDVADRPVDHRDERRQVVLDDLREGLAERRDAREGGVSDGNADAIQRQLRVLQLEGEGRVPLDRRRVQDEAVLPCFFRDRLQARGALLEHREQLIARPAEEAFARAELFAAPACAWK